MLGIWKFWVGFIGFYFSGSRGGFQIGQVHIDEPAWDWHLIGVTGVVILCKLNKTLGPDNKGILWGWNKKIEYVFWMVELNRIRLFFEYRGYKIEYWLVFDCFMNGVDKPIIIGDFNFFKLISLFIKFMLFDLLRELKGSQLNRVKIRWYGKGIPANVDIIDQGQDGVVPNGIKFVFDNILFQLQVCHCCVVVVCIHGYDKVVSGWGQECSM